jgi:hypothetical protein
MVLADGFSQNRIATRQFAPTTRMLTSSKVLALICALSSCPAMSQEAIGQPRRKFRTYPKPSFEKFGKHKSHHFCRCTRQCLSFSMAPSPVRSRLCTQVLIVVCECALSICIGALRAGAARKLVPGHAAESTRDWLAHTTRR